MDAQKSKPKRRSSSRTAQRSRNTSQRSQSSKRKIEPLAQVSDVRDRKVMDQRRWLCMSRPQLKKSCGMSSLVSCFNFLYSRLGAGSLEPITQETALEVVGINPPFDNVEFGSFTGNGTLKKWFRKLCAHYKVKGAATTFYKGAGPGKKGSAEEALQVLLDGLRGSDTAFIYHCYNHYFCPIGFELTPTSPAEAYVPKPSGTEPWIAIGETSCNHPCIHFKKWSDIVLDITSVFPQFYDIRRQEKGVQQREDPVYHTGAKAGTNLHCLISFSRLKD